MKILLLIETLSTGGAETFVIRLANALAKRHEVILAIMHGHKIEPGLGAQIDTVVKLEALRLPAERWLWRIDGALRRARIDHSLIRLLQRRWLRKILAQARPDVIHSHLLKADRLATEASSTQAERPRHVITMHGDYAPYLHGQADPLMLRAAERIGKVLDSADAVVAICRQHLDHLRADFPRTGDKLHFIYNGYAPPSGVSSEVQLPKDKFFFGMVSRGIEQKGWGVAVEAFRRLRREHAVLVLVGEGPAIERLRKDAPSEVIFAGFSPRPTDWIAKFDVCLLPTVYPAESLPTVIIEALYCGKPVIATDVGEIRTMLRSPDGTSAGILLNFDGSSVSVGEMTSAMARLMDDPATRSTMAAAAHAAFPPFDMEHCVKAYEAVYQGETPPSTSSTSANH